MRLLFFLLLLIAGLITLLIIGLIFLAVTGGGFNVLLPGLGLVVNGWAIIFFLSVINIIIIFLALKIRRSDAARYK